MHLATFHPDLCRDVYETKQSKKEIQSLICYRIHRGVEAQMNSQKRIILAEWDMMNGHLGIRRNPFTDEGREWGFKESLQGSDFVVEEKVCYTCL